VAALWFEAGESLYAAQVIGDVPDRRALEIASAIAVEFATRL